MDGTLNLRWAFGFNKDFKGSVNSLCLKDRNALFLTSSHSGVVYDFEHRTQTILQGHCNIISSCVVDKEKRWIVTADKGIDPILVVWDALSFVPVRTYQLPHESGIESLDISSDALFITTISGRSTEKDVDQEIAVWAWTTDSSDAILRRSFLTEDQHHSVKFDQNNGAHMVSNGCTSVLFWKWDEFSLECYSGKVSKTDLGYYGGDFVSTIFLPCTENAVTATTEGYIILWESKRTIDELEADGSNTLKEATKVLKLVECAINVMMTTSNDYLAMACADGAVRFYDYFLRLEAWFEDLNAGPVTSISFSVQDCPFSVGEAGAPGLKFWVPDFVVGTSDGFVVGIESSLFDEVRKEDRRGTLLMQGMSEEVVSIVCHPSQQLIAIACGNGVIQIWNYELKLLMILREFNGGISGSKAEDRRSATRGRNILRPRCISFDSTGSILAVGFNSGTIKLLQADTLEDLATFAPSSESIEEVRFSPSGTFLAAYDLSRHVLLFRRDVSTSEQVREETFHALPEAREQSKKDQSSFTYVGRALSHTAPITGIAFGNKDGVETLISVSDDQHCVEYDLFKSSVSRGVVCVCSFSSDGTTKTSQRIEISGRPAAVLWYPRLGEDDFEDKFIVANDEFKMKEYNLQSKQCRKTTLAPRFGNPPNRLLPIPFFTQNALGTQQDASSFKYYAYATPSRVVGVGSFPLTGSPAQVMGIVAHPSEITGLAVSFDGQFLFTGGGSDLSVNMWKLDCNQISTNSSALAPFYGLLDGGEGGELHRDIVDYFYYCQLRHMGEDSMEPRNLHGLIPLEEIPSLFRSVGYYPSEEEVANFMNEIRYSQFMVTGETQDYIDLEELVKLYINHRPALPLDKQLILSSFSTILDSLDLPRDELDWDELLYCLTSQGEKIPEEDLNSYLVALTGSGLDGDHRGKYDAKRFAGQLLGFEDF